MAFAAAGTDSKSAIGTADFPDFPGEDFLAHLGSQYKEHAIARLAARSLLIVAQGGTAPEAEKIVDIDITLLPELPAGHRDYNRRQEARIKIMAQNQANDRARQLIQLRAWTELYTPLYMSCDLLSLGGRCSRIATCPSRTA